MFAKSGGFWWLGVRIRPRGGDFHQFSFDNGEIGVGDGISRPWEQSFGALEPSLRRRVIFLRDVMPSHVCRGEIAIGIQQDRRMKVCLPFTKLTQPVQAHAVLHETVTI